MLPSNSVGNGASGCPVQSTEGIPRREDNSFLGLEPEPLGPVSPVQLRFNHLCGCQEPIPQLNRASDGLHWPKVSTPVCSSFSLP